MVTRSAAPRMRIGTSGWAYDSWRKDFFPAKTPRSEFLAYASRVFNSIEIDSTFYGTQPVSRYQNWYESTPDGFLFAIKGSRYITHMLKLKNCEHAVGNFFASGVLALREKLGPVLWQFSAKMPLDFDRFETFAKMLPRDLNEARELGLRHDKKLRRKPYLTVKENLPLRHAFELRNDKFFDKDFLVMLREYNIATVMASTAEKWPLFTDVTANFIYVRMHGEHQLYSGSYNQKTLDKWKHHISFWQKGCTPPELKHYLPAAPDKRLRPIFMYFDNTEKAQAPVDALRFMKMMGVKWSPEHTPRAA